MKKFLATSAGIIFLLLITLTFFLSRIKYDTLNKSYASEEDEEQTTASFDNIDTTQAEGIIVKYKQNISDQKRTETYKKYKPIKFPEKRRRLSFDEYDVLETPPEDIQTTIDELQKDPEVEYAEPDYYLNLDSIPNDPLFPKQWWLTKIQAPQAWDISKGSGSVIVGVVDSGVNMNHPDLKGKVIKTMNTQSDGPNHGTHVAGIISAVTNNSIGVAGIGYSVKLISVDTSSGTKLNISRAIEGIKWATDNGAGVINMSWSGSGSSNTLQNAINYAWSKGVVLVAAAGNSGNNKREIPAAYPHVISVAATTSNDKLASFSTRGGWVTVAAPGASILSTVGSNDYISYSGTSMASPVVAGLAALIKSAFPNFNNQQIVDRICSSSDKIGGTGSNFKCGRVNAYKALQGAVPGSSNPPNPSGGPTGSPNPEKSLIFKLRFQGITTKAKDISTKVVLSLGNSVKYTGTPTISPDNSGVYTLFIDNSSGTLLPGTYELKVKGTSHLQKKFQNLAYSGGGQTFDLSKLESQMQKAGDVNADNQISIEDVSQLLRYYTNFSVPVSTQQMESSDIDKDGFITIQDVALLAINWSSFAVKGDY